MKRLSALLLAFACIASLQADPLASRNRASIDASGTYRGNFALNQAAGDAQQQSNVRVVAVGSAALVGSDQRQHLQLDASQPIAASASISGRRCAAAASSASTRAPASATNRSTPSG